jgi:CBS domain-containing protein
VKELMAKDVMTREVLAVGADWPLDRLTNFLVENSISGVPVTSEEGRLLGVVSVTDIVRHTSLPGKEPHSHEPHEYYLHPSGESRYRHDEIAELRIDGESTVTVRDIMTPAIFNVKEDTPLKIVADTMIRGRIHRLLVTRGDKVTGIIAALDLLKVIRDS